MRFSETFQGDYNSKHILWHRLGKSQVTPVICSHKPERVSRSLGKSAAQCFPNVASSVMGDFPRHSALTAAGISGTTYPQTDVQGCQSGP